MGHHANMAKLALAEVVEFDNAVGEAKSLLGNDSLIIVTADHSHPFNIVGYARRGNNIFGRFVSYILLTFLSTFVL